MCDINDEACYLKIDDKKWFTLGCYVSKKKCDQDFAACNNSGNCSVTCCGSDKCNNPNPPITSAPTSGESTAATLAPTSGCDFIEMKTLLLLAMSMIASSLIKAAL